MARLGFENGQDDDADEKEGFDTITRVYKGLVFSLLFRPEKHDKAKKDLQEYKILLAS